MNTIIKNLAFKSDFGNVIYDKYLANNKSKAVIQIAHGMIEHRGRYQWLCESFAKEGYTVFINDHRGHGDSIGGNVRHGEMGEAGFERAVEDMFLLHSIITKEYPSQNFVLLGHSMGSLLARRFLQRYEDKLDALILSGTPSPHHLLRFASLFFKLLDTLNMPVSRKTSNIFSFNTKFHTYQKRQGKPDNSYWACSDEKLVNAFLADEKSQFQFTFNSLSTLLAGMNRVFSRYPQKPLNPDLPIVFLSGTEDVCGNFSTGVIKAHKHICHQGYKNVSIKLYEEARHEVFNEPCKDNVFADTLKWLKMNNL